LDEVGIGQIPGLRREARRREIQHCLDLMMNGGHSDELLNLTRADLAYCVSLALGNESATLGIETLNVGREVSRPTHSLHLGVALQTEQIGHCVLKLSGREGEKVLE
jgi:hypothetical protein